MDPDYNPQPEEGQAAPNPAPEAITSPTAKSPPPTDFNIKLVRLWSTLL